MSAITKSYTVTRPLAIRRFGLHFLEMCVAAMCMGGILVNTAVFSALLALNPNFVTDATALAMLIVATNLAIAMAIYMYLRKHPLQHNIEMSGSTVVGAIPFIVALWLGWIPAESTATWRGLFVLMCGPLCVLMFVVMVVRFDHYGGRVGAVVAASATGEYTCPMHPEVRQAGPGQCPACGMNLVRRAT